MNEQEPVLNIYVFYISQIYSNPLQTFSTIVTASASGFFLFAPKKHVAIDLKKTGIVFNATTRNTINSPTSYPGSYLRSPPRPSERGGRGGDKILGTKLPKFFHHISYMENFKPFFFCLTYVACGLRLSAVMSHDILKLDFSVCYLQYDNSIKLCME